MLARDTFVLRDVATGDVVAVRDSQIEAETVAIYNAHRYGAGLEILNRDWEVVQVVTAAPPG